MKTMRTIDTKISLVGDTGFNSGSINLFITICDYDEEYDDDDEFLTRAAPTSFTGSLHFTPQEALPGA